MIVSIQLVAPASGALRDNYASYLCHTVSIQLVAPASGAYRQQELDLDQTIGFHSIGCPSEWGLGRV